MELYYEGMIACAAILGGLCAFNYWMFNVIENKLEIKIDFAVIEISKIANELKEERKARDGLYSFVLDHYRKEDK